MVPVVLPLCQDVVYNLAGNVGQTILAALETVGHPFVIQAKIKPKGKKG